MQRSDKRYARVVHCVHCLGDNGFAPTETECRLVEMHRRICHGGKLADFIRCK